MINQRLYPDIKLGNSALTVATDGCFFSSVYAGLVLAGYTFTVKEFMQLLVDRGVFPAGSGLLSAPIFAQKVSDIFLEGRKESWDDAKIVSYLQDKSYIVVGEVSGKGIGGTGQHFVRIDHVDVKPDGKISMTYIDDPWGGLEDQKVTTRYNAFGNILSLRVFKIIVKGGQTTMPETQVVNTSDWNRLLKASRLGDRLINGLGVAGNIADKSEQQIDELITVARKLEEDKKALNDQLKKAGEQVVSKDLELTAANSKLAEANKKIKELEVSKPVGLPPIQGMEVKEVIYQPIKKGGPTA